MAERDELQGAREAARQAREEAQRLRDRARELERQLRHEARSRHHVRFETHFDNGGASEAGDQAPPSTQALQALLLDGVNTVELHQTAGKIVVRPCQPGEVAGIDAVSNKVPPKLEVVRDGDRLRIDIKLSVGWLFRRRTGASAVLRLDNRPFDVVKVNVGAGEIEVHDLEARELHLNTGAGEIKTFSTKGDIDADTGAGRIQVNAHRGTVRCDTGTGDVVIDIAEAPPGEYRANVGMGRAELRLPPGLEAFIRTSSGIGKSVVDYPSAGEGAPIRVKLDTGIGEASVRARKAATPPPPSPAGGKAAREPRQEAARRRREGEQLRVLQLLEQGKISTQEAAELIAALTDVDLGPGPEDEQV